MTSEGSNRASAPTAVTPRGHTRTTFAEGRTSRIMPTALASIPSSTTTTSGRWITSRCASSSVDVASATTSKPSFSNTNRSRPFLVVCPSPTMTRTRCSPIVPRAAYLGGLRRATVEGREPSSERRRPIDPTFASAHDGGSGYVSANSGVCHNDGPRPEPHPRGHVSDTVERTSSSQTSQAGDRPAAAASSAEPRPALGPLLALIDERVPVERRETVAAFAKAYLRRLADDEIAAAPAEELYGLVCSTFEFVDGRRLHPWVVRAFNPEVATDGFTAPGTILETNVDDSPFLVDSVTEELTARNLVRPPDPAPGHRHVARRGGTSGACLLGSGRLAPRVGHALRARSSSDRRVPSRPGGAGQDDPA